MKSRSGGTSGVSWMRGSRASFAYLVLHEDLLPLHLSIAELEALYSSLSLDERHELLQCLLVMAGREFIDGDRRKPPARLDWPRAMEQRVRENWVTSRFYSEPTSHTSFVTSQTL